MEIEGVKLHKVDDAFIMDIEGHTAIGVALPVSKSREVAGEVGATPAAGKVAGKYENETEQRWFIFTDEKNPQLRDYEHLTVMAAKALSEASGSPVRSSEVAVSGTHGVSAPYGIDAVFVGPLDEPKKQQEKT